MSVDKRVLGTERGIPHDLVEDGDILIVLLTMLIELVLDHQVTVVALHALVYLRKIQNILSGVLNHVPGQRSLLPEGVIVSHHRMNLFLL